MFVYACVSAMQSEVSLVWVVWETKKPGITGVFNRVGIYNMDASLEKWKINLNDVRRIFFPRIDFLPCSQMLDLRANILNTSLTHVLGIIYLKALG